MIFCDIRLKLERSFFPSEQFYTSENIFYTSRLSRTQVFSVTEETQISWSYVQRRVFQLSIQEEKEVDSLKREEYSSTPKSRVISFFLLTIL